MLSILKGCWLYFLLASIKMLLQIPDPEYFPILCMILLLNCNAVCGLGAFWFWILFELAASVILMWSEAILRDEQHFDASYVFELMFLASTFLPMTVCACVKKKWDHGIWLEPLLFFSQAQGFIHLLDAAHFPFGLFLDHWNRGIRTLHFYLWCSQ